MKNIHFIAIGGAVMHQLAIALQRTGNTVTGSDDEINDPAKTNLAAAGILPEKQGWYPEKISKSLDAIVLGMHARLDNPELVAAQQAGIPIFSFPEYVYEVSKEKKRVVVAGSHGKTTITSMIMHVLKDTLAFDYLVGAKVAGFEQSVQLTNAPVIVLEGDEYPASPIEKRLKIFFYHPHISVLSGIAWDHINVFPTYENYLSQFATYLQTMEAGSLMIYNAEDEAVLQLVKTHGQHLKLQAYAMPPFHYDDGTAVLDTSEGAIPVSVFGRHNLLNMEAAREVCSALGITDEVFYKSIASFTGAARRLEKLTERENFVAYRDFAHAPSKLQATLDAVREAYPNHKLVAAFELHTFSSLNEQFLSEYAGSMQAPDEAMVFFSNHALQLKGLPKLERSLVKSYFEREDLTVTDDKGELEKLISAAIRNQEKPVCLLLMSSGTFDGIDWNNVVSQTVSSPL